MPVFVYKGKTLAGSAVEGELKATSKEDLEREVREIREDVERSAVPPKEDEPPKDSE